MAYAQTSPQPLAVAERPGGDVNSSNVSFVNTKTASATTAFAARFGQPVSTATGADADVVLYARDAAPISGDWQLVADLSAAGGTRISSPDHGVAKISAASAMPASSFELTFDAQAGVPYHVWLRMKADNDSWQNDSVFAQFSDSVDTGGNAIWRVGTTSATIVSLEDCGGCGEQGWGWKDNGYGTAGTPVYFASSGTHTIRIQQREDGVSIDQIVLSSATWASTPPGANRNDATIVPTGGPSNQLPAVSALDPADGAQFIAPASIWLGVNAGDPDGHVTQVAFYANSTLIATTTSTTSSYYYSWDNVPAGSYALTAVATDDRGATTTSSTNWITVMSNTGGMPQSWTDADVGAVGYPGRAYYDSGTGVFNVHGAGADVWGTADAFNYAYTSLTGDGQIVARVASVSGEANWVKAGVMIRGSLSASSTHASMLVSYAKGIAFQRRLSDGGTSVSTSGGSVTAPYWVRLVRTGDVVTAAASADGATWVTVGSDTIALGATADVGLAVSSHVSGTLATATFDHVTIASAAPRPDPNEIVMYPAQDATLGSAAWTVTSDTTAAGGARLWNPDHGAAKVATVTDGYPDYFDITFTATAGVPYHLWLRGKADADYYGNDSVFVQFSNSGTWDGVPVFRIGSSNATTVVLEDCIGCGEQGWGWQDDDYDGFGAPIYFDKDGPQTIRVIRREDGFSIDQIVLSAGEYFNAAPGTLKNDATIVPR